LGGRGSTGAAAPFPHRRADAAVTVSASAAPNNDAVMRGDMIAPPLLAD